MIPAPSPNHDSRAGQAIDMLVIHYTGMPSAEAALARLRDPASKVSAHYMIDERGRVFALVPEARRAWHAGVAYWAGARNINQRALGIELVNPGHEFGYRPFPPAQMDALLELCREILARHRIVTERILGHSDVAPARKQDPGELFDWPWLARFGVGLWPPPGRDRLKPPAAEAALPLLGRIGYDVLGVAPPFVIAAFQRRFCFHRCDGALDERTLQRIAAVVSCLR